jgi:hypothetical protein
MVIMDIMNIKKKINRMIINNKIPDFNKKRKKMSLQNFSLKINRKIKVRNLSY